MKSLKKLGKKFIHKKARIKEKYCRNFIFIHINKTGGISIASALGIKQEHLTALEHKNKLGKFKQWLWDRKFIFAVVRNPWERVVSQYAYRLKVNKCNMKSNPIEFNEWLRLAYVEQVPEYYDEPRVFIPQIDWLIDEQGKIIVDYIARFENLEQEFRHICALIGVKAKLPHLNRSPRADYREYYNSRSIEIVGQHFQKDIEYFNYSFS